MFLLENDSFRASCSSDQGEWAYRREWISHSTILWEVNPSSNRRAKVFGKGEEPFHRLSVKVEGHFILPALEMSFFIFHQMLLHALSILLASLKSFLKSSSCYTFSMLTLWALCTCHIHFFKSHSVLLGLWPRNREAGNVSSSHSLCPLVWVCALTHCCVLDMKCFSKRLRC